MARLNEPNRRRVLLGEITSVHGIRGEVVVRSYTQAPEDVAAYGALANESGDAAFALEVVRVTPKGVVARIEGIGDRTAAEKLRGTRLYIDRAQLPDAESGAYYHADLIGLRAVDPAGSSIGHIVAVHNFGAGDILEIRREGTKTTELVPFTHSSVPTVDLAAGKVVVDLPAESEDEGP